MGLNDEHARRVCFDVETFRIDNAADYLSPVSAPSNYKDPDKIQAYCQEKHVQQLEKAALHPDLCRVVAIGALDEAMIAAGKAPLVNVCRDEKEEVNALIDFWKLFGAQVLVGYHCIDFDLPVLLRRSLYLGVDAPHFDLNKYRPSSNVVDLLQLLSFHGKFDYWTLTAYCRRFGLAVDDDDVTGSDIARLVEEGNWEAVRQHCQRDVQKTAALAQRLGYMRRSQPAEVL